MNRYIWVYINWDEVGERIELNTWMSPDMRGRPFQEIDTPFVYNLTRNEVRYTLESEVQLSQALAIRIAGTIYDTEFVLPRQKSKKVRR